MSGTWYVTKTVLPGGTWSLGVPSNPNTFVTAPAGSIAQAADGSGPWKNTTGGTVWLDLSAGGGGSSPFVATNEFWIDTTVVDSPAFAALRMFSTIPLALAAVNGGALGAGLAAVFRCREEQTHSWTGAGYLGDRALTLYGVGGANGDVGTAELSFPTGFTLAGGSIFIKNMLITAVGVIDMTAGNAVFEDCTASGGDWSFGTASMSDGLFGSSTATIETSLGLTRVTCTSTSFTPSADGAGITSLDCEYSGTTWGTAPAQSLNVSLGGGTVDIGLSDGDVLFRGDGALAAILCVLTGVTIKATLSSVTEDPSYLFVDAAVVLTNVSIQANLSDADANLVIIRDSGSLISTMEMNDLRVSYGGPGSMSYEAGVVATTNNGCTILGASIGGPSGAYYNNGLGFVAVEP